MAYISAVCITFSLVSPPKGLPKSLRYFRVHTGLWGSSTKAQMRIEAILKFLCQARDYFLACFTKAAEGYALLQR